VGNKHPHVVRGGVVVTLPNPYCNFVGVDLLQRNPRQAGTARVDWLSD
jgi:hypothetical protein